MAALRVDAELGLVDGGEGEVALEVELVARITGRHGHALGGAEEIARLWWDDPLLAGEEGDLRLALHGDDAVVDLAGEQAQREADDSGRMAAHPLDRQVRLAGVGGSEDGPDRSV